MLSAFDTIRTDPLAFLEWSWRKYGDVVQFPIPKPPTFLVTHPDGVRRVLQANHRGYGKATVQYSRLALVTGEGLLAADTEAWRRQRKLVQPAFHPRSVRSVVDHTGVAVERMLARWDDLGDGAVVDVDDEMMRTALEIVGASLFGADLRGESEVLVAATQQGLHEVVARARNPLAPPTWVPTPGNLRLNRAVARLDKAVAEILAARRAQPTPAEPVDMLDWLLAVSDLGESELRDQIVTFIVAGHETVASALTWAWYLLGKDASAADRLAAEAEARCSDQRPGFDDLPHLPWAHAVFDEALRLYPPGWLITRKSLVADEILGHRLPAGSLVIISPYLVHRHDQGDPSIEDFDPGRFLAGIPSPQTGVYIPFGAGPRLCIGREMARAEGALLLSMASRRWRLASTDPAPARPQPLVMLKPKGGLRMRLRRRT
ncbi:MAG: Cytochrome [Actinomycetota bacterium]|nr:Cytochrome [Actinomycetota bacterium]